MEVIVQPYFIKQLLRLPNAVQEDVKEVLEILSKCKSLQESGLHITKMEGQKSTSKYYRIRTGDYRIGVSNINPKIIVLVIVKRNDIYKVFPPKK